MNDPKTFETGMSGGTGLKGVLADPLSLATKPPVIFKFASAVSKHKPKCTKNNLSPRILTKQIFFTLDPLFSNIFMRFVSLV